MLSRRAIGFDKGYEATRGSRALNSIFRMHDGDEEKCTKDAESRSGVGEQYRGCSETV